MSVFLNLMSITCDRLTAPVHHRNGVVIRSHLMPLNLEHHAAERCITRPHRWIKPPLVTHVSCFQCHMESEKIKVNLLFLLSRGTISTSLIVEGAFLIHKNGNDFVRFFFRSQVFRKAVFISSGSSQQTSLDLENLQRRAQCFCVSRGRWLSRVIKPSVYIFVRLLVSAVKKKSEINCLKINWVYSMWHLTFFYSLL